MSRTDHGDAQKYHAMGGDEKEMGIELQHTVAIKPPEKEDEQNQHHFPVKAVQNNTLDDYSSHFGSTVYKGGKIPIFAQSFMYFQTMSVVSALMPIYGPWIFSLPIIYFGYRVAKNNTNDSQHPQRALFQQGVAFAASNMVWDFAGASTSLMLPIATCLALLGILSKAVDAYKFKEKTDNPDVDRSRVLPELNRFESSMGSSPRKDCFNLGIIHPLQGGKIPELIQIPLFFQYANLFSAAVPTAYQVIIALGTYAFIANSKHSINNCNDVTTMTLAMMSNWQQLLGAVAGIIAGIYLNPIDSAIRVPIAAVCSGISLFSLSVDWYKNKIQRQQDSLFYPVPVSASSVSAMPATGV